MRNFYFALCIVFTFSMSYTFASEVGMPQLNTEFWIAQVFWLTLIFSGLYIIIWKIFLPRITDSVENRKLKVVNDLNETQKFKESVEKKINEYNKIIEQAKKEAKKIIESNKKKLEDDINNKKKKFNEEIEKELIAAEKEIKILKKSSISNVNNIAVEISSEVIRQIVGTEVNMSNISAIVEDVSKTKEYHQ